MLRQQAQKSKSKRGPTKYVGICQQAAVLGVTRIHLWRVLTGQRHSPPLLARYRALVANRKAQHSIAA